MPSPAVSTPRRRGDAIAHTCARRRLASEHSCSSARTKGDAQEDHRFTFTRVRCAGHHPAAVIRDVTRLMSFNGSSTGIRWNTIYVETLGTAAVLPSRPGFLLRLSRLAEIRTAGYHMDPQFSCIVDTLDHICSFTTPMILLHRLRHAVSSPTGGFIFSVFSSTLTLYLHLGRIDVGNRALWRVLLLDDFRRGC